MNERDKPELSLPLKQYLESEPPVDFEAAVWAKLRVRRGAVRSAEQAHASLPLPLGQVLTEGGDEVAAARARLWRGVRARLHRPRARRVPRRVALLLAATLGAVAALGLFALIGRPLERLASQQPSAPQAAAKLADATPPAGASMRPTGVLLTADGRTPGLVDAQAGARTLRLSDASEIRVEQGAQLEPVLSTGSRFELLLARGTADFSVTPGGPRRWAIDAGVVRVEVVGTQFRVARHADHVDVSVSHGVVLVIGEDVPGRVRRLRAGEALSVAQRPIPAETKQEATTVVPPQPPPATTPEAPAARAPAGSSSAGAAPRRQLPNAASASEEAGSLNGVLVRSALDARRRASEARRRASASEAQGGAESPHERYAALGSAGLVRATMQATSIEELLELADIARLSGHPQDAVAPLTRALDKFAGSNHAGLAAFTLGRVLLDQLGVATPAAEAFERAITLGLPKGLRADCYRRLAEAYGRAGNEAARARAEARFQTEFALPSSTLDKVAP